MKPTILRSTLISAFGVLIALMGMAPVSGTPLLVITGVGLLIYGTLMMFKIPSDYGDAPVIKRSSASAAQPCQTADHAGCQDSPDCSCGCHRERIEVRINAF